MSELAAHSLRQPFYELDPTQRQIMQVLKLNKEQLEHNELSLLRQLEERYTAIMGAASNSNSSNPNANLSHTSDKTSPSKSHSDQNTQDPNHSSLKLKISKGEIAQTSGLPCLSQDDLEDLLGDTSNLIKSSEDIVSSDVLLTSVADATKANQASTSQVQEESDHHPEVQSKPAQESNTQQLQEERISSTSHGDHPPAFSLLAPVHVPVTVTSQEILDMCKKRHTQPDEYCNKPIFDEHVPPPKAPVVNLKKKLTKDKLLLKTPLIVVENGREALTTELQNFCYNSPIALVHGLTAALKIDLSQFSTKDPVQNAWRRQLDHLGQPTWACYSAKSYTTIGRYGQYQAESFRHSLKEETEKLKQTGANVKYVPEPQKSSGASPSDAGQARLRRESWEVVWQEFRPCVFRSQWRTGFHSAVEDDQVWDECGSVR
uniref:Uncharacterized protein n=1 Tax=Ditylenchus dipsaci TaxID=166011 RepID=A0A915DKR4_9BILA